ncbi:hypothetical protein BN946_scf184943.g13 [Trametes cinnabarina]|uniref:DUF6534 domain-containing protein n=1 Tax=Pycnoporus cinnabarinus TaxID=5643 RepID=A0A060SIC8_PYCCI|nr:hypothetical protein BN946_scf184943.g13 [Trametes cinnabarina]
MACHPGCCVNDNRLQFIFVHELTDLHRISWMVSVAYGFAVSSDLILTGALVFVLQKSRTGSKRTNNILDTLIIYTINTGLLTSIVSVFAFVFALVIPGNLIYAAVSIVGAKLYANSVLALYVWLHANLRLIEE